MTSSLEPPGEKYFQTVIKNLAEKLVEKITPPISLVWQKHVLPVFGIGTLVGCWTAGEVSVTSRNTYWDTCARVLLAGKIKATSESTGSTKSVGIAKVWAETARVLKEHNLVSFDLIGAEVFDKCTEEWCSCQ